MRPLATSLLALISATAAAQGTPAAQSPAAQSPAAQSPAAQSPEASQLLQKACDRMLAAGNGTYTSTESQDNAILRSAHLPMNGKETEVSGGWHGDLSWASAGDNQDQLMRSGGRMLVKDGNDWKLRHNMLPSGGKAPFTVDPSLLFAMLRDLPADARKVVNVDTAEVGGKATTVLSLQLRDAAARDFALSGAIPPTSGGPGGGMVMMIGGGGPPGEPDCDVDLALFVDAQSGDVLRVRARVYESNPDAGNVHIQIQGPGGGDSADEDDKEDAKAEKKDQKPVFKKGLVDRKPTKTESLMYFKADFKAIGATKAPELADKQKALLNRR